MVAFGGYTVNFGGRKESMQDVFGDEPIAPSEMTKKLWTYVKKYELGGKH